MDSAKRRRVGMLGSFVAHVIIFLFISCTGIFHVSTEREDIAEIAFFGGGGGGGSGGESIEQMAEQAIPDAPVAEQAEEKADVQPDAILEHSDTAKKTITNKPQGNKNTATGIGTGSGGGIGSGYGSGRGSGSGGGVGSGHGTGYGSGSGEGVMSNPAVPPRIVRSVQPQYPTEERNAGIEGTAVIRFLIGYDGHIESVSVIKSSGNINLDEAALNACAKWKFTGARNARGQKVKCYSNVPITFRMKK